MKTLFGTILISFVCILSSSFAQDNDATILEKDPIYASKQSYIGDPINIEAYQRNRKVDMADRELIMLKSELQKQKKSIVLNKKKAKNYKELAKTTEKLADSTEAMAQEKNESQKLIEEYNAKINCLEKNNYDTSKCRKLKKQYQDVVSVLSSAPQRPKSQLPLKKVDTVETEKSIHLMIGAGMKTYPNIDFVDGSSESFESDLALSLKLETDVHERVAVGGEFSYSTMTVTRNQPVNPFASFINQQLRTLSYKTISAAGYGKFFFLSKSRFRPYAGLSLGVTRSELNFNDRNNAQFAANTVVNANVAPYSGHNAMLVNGGLALGMDFQFSSLIGANIEGKFSKNFNSSTESQQAYMQVSDQMYVESIGASIDAASIIALSAALTMSF